MLAMRIVLCLLLPTLSVNQSLEILPKKKVVIHDLRSSSNLVSLVCRTKDDLSYTEAGLMWFGPDGRQITATYGNIQESLALKISSPNEEDGGVYTCKSAIGGQALEANVTLEMYRGISVTSATCQYPIVHSDARIMCQANSSQLMQLTWYKMDYTKGWDRIRTGSRYSLKSDYMLIKNITLKDDGTYICNIDVINMGDSKAHYINVTVTIPPEIERHITVVPPTPVEGDNLDIECVARGRPAPLYRFLKNGIPLAPMFVESGRHHLESVSRDDDGLYTCEAKNEGGLISSSVSLDVRVKPKIEPIGDFKVSENDTFRLVCVASGDPKPEVIWKRKDDQVFYKPSKNNNERVYVEEGISQDDEREVTEKEGKLSIARTNVTLIFTHMRPEDTSDYDCYAQNSVGNWTETTHVDVMHAPYFLGMSEIVHGRVGETSKMTCRAKGNPEPVIRWYFKGDKVLPVAPYVITDDPNAPSNEAISHLVVSVTESNKGNIFGLYTCRTDNRLGSNFMSHHLQEKDVFELTSLDPTPLDLNTVSTESYFHTLWQKPEYGVGKTTILRSEHTKNVMSKDDGKGLTDDEVYTTTLDLITTRKFTSSSATTFGTNKQEITSKRVQSRISATQSTVGPLKAATSDRESESYQTTTSVKHALEPVITSRIATFGKITKRKEVTSESPATSGIKTSKPAKTFRVKTSEITTIGVNGSGSVTIGSTAASGSNSNIGVHDSKREFSSGIIASEISSTTSIQAAKLLTPKGVITSEPLITEAVKASVSITIKGVNALEPSTIKGVELIESTITKGFQAFEPSKVITVSEPSTTKVITVSMPSITKVVRASEPSTTKVITASEPSTTIVVRASEPPITKVVRASEPSTTKVVTVSEPSTTNEVTASELAHSNRENTHEQTAISEFQASGLASTKLTVILDSSSNSTVAPLYPAAESKVKTSGSVSTSEVTSFRLVTSREMKRSDLLSTNRVTPFRLVTSREMKRSDLLSTSRVTPFRLATRSEAKTLDLTAAKGVETTPRVDISEPSAGSQLRTTTISKLSGLNTHGQVLETVGHSDKDFNPPFYLQSVASTRISTSVPSTSSGIGQPFSRISTSVPSASSGIGQPVSRISTSIPSTSSGIGQPFSRISTSIPSTSSGIGQPFSRISTSIPSTSSGIRQPFSRISTSIPSTSSGIRQPVSKIVDVEAIPAKDSASGEAHLASLNIFGIIVLTFLQTIYS